MVYFFPAINFRCVHKVFIFWKRDLHSLLYTSGEKLQTFILTNEENELSLDGFEAGTYTMRIEAKNEVIVKQIIIP